jgi:hypothetical protein
MIAKTSETLAQPRSWFERPVPRRLIPLMMTVSIICVFATYGIIRFGSIAAALSWAGGKRILVDAPVKSFGEVALGATASLNYTLRNETSHRITIQGAQSSCSCTVVDDVPCVIEPGASRTIGLKIAAPIDKDEVAGNISLYTDDRDTPVIVLGYEGRVVKPVVAGLDRDGPN